MMKTKYLSGLMLLMAGVFSLAACDDDDEYTVATGNIITTVETGEATVTATTASATGRVLDLSKSASSSYEVGIVWGTAQDPTTGGKRQIGSIDEAGNVSATITDLTKGVTYYYATYVCLQSTVTKFGQVKSFTTVDAVIATAEATDVTSVSALLGGVASADPGSINAGSSETEYGIRLSTSAADVMNGREYTATAASATFRSEVKGLLPGKTYYYTTYFKMGGGLVYGDTKSFTTLSKPMEYVDLGLSVMWAAYNLGAEAETEVGGLYGWGDLTGLQTSTYLNDYTPAESISGGAGDIALSVTAAIDSESEQQSMTPTLEQFEELISKTTQEFTTVEGVAGYRFTARNGKSIFLPVTGYREGEAVSAEDVQGLYWTGIIDEVNSDYGKTIKFGEGGLAQGLSQRNMGLAIRTVRAYDAVEAMEAEVEKLVVGDLEDNGRIRIEIYNEYGNTKANPGINTTQVKFNRNMLVRFKMSGITDNLKEGAAGVYTAGLEFADADWWPGLWSDFHQKYDTKINGDGEYTVWMETDSEVDGAVVFCVDIENLHNDLVDASLVKVESLQLMFDVDDSTIQYYVDNSKVLFNNKDGNGTDGRIEIYNEWGDTHNALGADYSDFLFGGCYLLVNFTITGIDGNLIDGAAGSYHTELSWADQWWGTQYWGGTPEAAATVTGDGTYEVWAPLAGEAHGPCVWTIELYGLWKDLADTSKVQATINKVIAPGKK